MADIVVPGTHFLERNDFNANWVTFRSLGLRQQVVPSWIGGLTETQFFLELGNALGLEGFKTKAGEDDTDANLLKTEWTTFMATGNNKGPWNNQVNWDNLKATGVWIETGATGGTQYERFLAKKKFASGDTISEIVAGSEKAYVIKGSDGTAKGIATGPTMNVDDEYYVGLATDSRRAQFWSPTMDKYFTGQIAPANKVVTGDLRYHPLPYYLPPEDAPSATYPLYFISWKEVEHTHTRTFNNEWLMEMKRQNRIFVHSTLATAKNLSEDDWVWVQSPHGMVRARVHITDGIQKETVGFHRGFGHWALGKVAKGQGTHDGWLLPGKAEIHSGQAVHKEVACRITKDI